MTAPGGGGRGGGGRGGAGSDGAEWNGAAGPRPQAAIVVLTDRMLAAAAGHDVVAVCAAAVGAGADRVVVREKDLGVSHRSDLVAAVVAAVGGGRVIVATGPAPTAEEVLTWADLRVAGLHLASGGAARVRTGSSPGVAAALPWGRSCHDATEVAAAAASGASWVTASPVALSTSKLGYGPALGEAGLRRLVAAARAHGRPAPGVWALGGVDVGNAATWPRAGADAVAVLGAVMSAPDPAAAVRDLRTALDTHLLRGTS